MSEYVIKQGIPLPPSGRGDFIKKQKGQGKIQLLVKQMNLGDMIETDASKVASFATAARNQGMKLTSRKMESGKIGVWRIE